MRACATFEIKNGKNDIPLPRQTEIICICTDSPDQEQIAAVRKGEIDCSAKDAARAPEETSRNPVKRAFSHCGAWAMAGREHSVPEIAENVITQAETFSIFLALRHIASVTACDRGTSGEYV